MKKFKTISVLLMALVMIVTMTAGAFADSVEMEGEAVFTGRKIESTLNSEEVADALSNLQPGDEFTLTVSFKNEHDEDTDWYMANEVLQTLEKTDAARKTLAGTGTPENGGYTYELLLTDKDGKETVLFSNSKVGGDAVVDGMEGLEQAVNALDDWFYIETLSKGEQGTVTLHIEFEGETEVNDYMDTDGGVAIVFAVGLEEQPVKTGDTTSVWPFVGMFMLGGILLVRLLIFGRKRREGGEE